MHMYSHVIGILSSSGGDACTWSALGLVAAGEDPNSPYWLRQVRLGLAVLERSAAHGRCGVKGRELADIGRRLSNGLSGGVGVGRDRGAALRIRPVRNPGTLC